MCVHQNFSTHYLPEDMSLQVFWKAWCYTGICTEFLVVHMSIEDLYNPDTVSETYLTVFPKAAATSRSGLNHPKQTVTKNSSRPPHNNHKN